MFYSKFAIETAKKWIQIWSLLRTIKRLGARVENDPSKDSYTDLALTAAVDEDLDTLDIFGATESGKDAVNKYRPRVTEAVPTIAAE